MPYLLAETVIEDFTTDWRPTWEGEDRIFSVADSAEDPSQFIGCGTDGLISFRVKGEKEKFLQAFRDLMEREGAREVQPQVQPQDVVIEPPPFPNAISVQDGFDEYYGVSQAA
jgi:hypothetical protein